MNDKYLKNNSSTANFKYNNLMFEQNDYFEVYNNAVILPYKDGKCGVIDEKGNFVENSKYNGIHIKYGGEYCFDKSDLIYDDCEAVYLGKFIEHWGHFLGDSIPRLHILNNEKFVLNNKIKFVFVASDNQNLQKNHYELFELLGIKKEQIVLQKNIVKYKKVYVPSVSVDDNFNCTKGYIGIFDRIIENFNFDDFNKYYVPKKVYFTRRNFHKAKISEVGEYAIEKNFASNGFVVLSPENLSLREQILIFNKSDIIASLNGTISLNIIFNKSKNKLVVLNKSRLIHKDLFRNSSMRDMSIDYIDVYEEPIKGYPKSIGYGPFFLNTTKEFINYFKDNNLIYKNKNFLNNIIDYFIYLAMISKRLLVDKIKNLH